ncbi:MAG TPA: GNVR domain-containing protein [Candidatus Acidoferrales bacterium]|nr:GNVR domain-containing protein [Candidatus Acidoferrales bacterium]
MSEKPERPLDWRDYRDVLARRRWTLLGALFAAGLATTIGAGVWPVRYRSRALVLVERQDVPSQYVQPNVTSNADERLAGITQQVLSRTRLENLIQRFDLYPNDRQWLDRDNLVEKMRKDIEVEPVDAAGRNELTAFRIGYTYYDARTAQQVANEMTSEFINESLQARTQASAATTDFLATELEQARKNLADQEARLREYKGRYLGELPEQQQTNLEILSSLEAQLYSESNARDRAEQQKIYLESLASAYRSLNKASPAADAAAGRAGATPAAVIDKAITGLQQQLTELEAKYTPNYPDVVRVREQIAGWQAMRRKAETAATRPAAAPAGGGPRTAADPGAQNLAEIDSRLKATAAEIAFHEREVNGLRARIADAQARLRLTPLREEELAQVTRDDQNAREEYQSLLQKKMQSELATNLEKREEGERLRIIDPASLPRKPVAPNRLEIIVSGWVLGLAAGVGLMTAEEAADERLRGETDVRQLARLAVLARVPMLRSAAEERRRLWLRIGEIAGVTVLALVSAGLGIYVCLAG